MNQIEKRIEEAIENANKWMQACLILQINENEKYGKKRYAWDVKRINKSFRIALHLKNFLFNTKFK